MDIDYIKKGYLLVHLNDLIEIFQKMVQLIGFGVTVCEM